MKIREIFNLPEPQRTKALEEVSETQAIMVYSDKAFPVRYRGKIEQIKAGENAVTKLFGIYLLRKFSNLSEDPIGSPSKGDQEPKSDYFNALVDINGIGATRAEAIEKEYPTPAELLEAAKADRLPDGLKKYKDAFLEVF